MNTKNKKTPMSHFSRYIGIFVKQFFTNREYAYFLLISVLMHLILIGSPRPLVWIVIFILDVLIGILGIASVVRPIDKAFENIGLDYSIGYGFPRWIVQGRYPFAQDTLRLNAAGYAESDFESRTHQIASRLNLPIREIRKPSAHHPVIEVVIKRSALPQTLLFSSLPFSSLKSGEIFIGQSDDGIETLSLSRMIHMLVAGQTGAGKTIFTRQVIGTVLSHTRHSHVCLTDMKGGIDYHPFKDVPNFEMATDYQSADEMLDAITRLFELRRDYLSKKKKSQWHELLVKELDSHVARAEAA